MHAALRRALDAQATAYADVQKIQDARAADGYDPTDPQQGDEAFTRALDVLDGAGQQVAAEHRAERLGADVHQPAPGQRGTNPRGGDHGDEDGAGEGRDVEADYRDAFGAYLRRGSVDRLPPEQRRLLEAAFDELSQDEQRALGVGDDAAGGFTVPKEFLQRMTEAEKEFGGIGGLAEQLVTGNGRELSWPTNDSTAQEGHILTENTEDTELDVVFGSQKLAAHMYTSRVVRLSRQLLQDTAFNLEVWLPGKLGERIGRASARHFAVGTGIDQPQGLLTGLTTTRLSAAVGKVTFDDLVVLEHAIDPAYRNRAGARYVLSDDALLQLRLLKDSDGRRLWQPELTAGTPATLNGKPYTIDNSLPALANGQKAVVYGDIRAAYVVRRVTGAQVLRLNERYATSLQVAFLGFERIDGRVQDQSAAAVLVVRAAA